MFEVCEAKNIPEHSFGYCWVKGISGTRSFATPALAFFFWGCHQVTKPADLHEYLDATSPLKALRSPVLQLYFCRRALEDLSPAVPSESL